MNAAFIANDADERHVHHELRGCAPGG